MHWADESLLDFVDHLVDWASGVPLLVVCTARPELLERRPGWGGGKTNALTISLSPLSDEDTTRLVGALIQRAVLPADTQELLLARAGGNPLYAEQYARLLEDRQSAASWPFPRPCRDSSPRGWICSIPARRRCSRTRRSWGRCFGSGRSPPFPAATSDLPR